MPHPDTGEEEHDRRVGRFLDAALGLMLGACVAGLIWWGWTVFVG